MLDVRNLVPMESDQAVKLAQASQAKASELTAAREVIAARFVGQKRISLDTVLKELDASIAEYSQGADPTYWTSPAPVAPVVNEDATPEATAPITQEQAAEANADETPKAGRKR